MSSRLATSARITGPSCSQCVATSIFSARQTASTGARRYASHKKSKSKHNGTTPSTAPPQKSKPLPSKPQTLPYQASQQQRPLRPDTFSQHGSSNTGHAGNNSEAQPITEIIRQRIIPIFGMGAAALCIGAFVATSIYHWRNDEVVRYPPGREPQVPTGRSNIQSPVEFDQHLDKSEWRLGITKLRRRLAEESRGHVLEVAVGAGRNFEHYDWERVTEELLTQQELNKLKLARSGWGKKGKVMDQQQDSDATVNGNGLLSFTGIDISPAMLDIAMKRMRTVVPYLAEREQLPAKPVWTLFSQHASKPLIPGTSAGDAMYSLLNNKIRIIQCDAQNAMPAPASTAPGHPRFYDTIIQTFGLCSVRDPVSLLTNMSTLLKPDTGRIILLEHGLSIWDLINGFLDRSARGHFEKFGCWWNRDIEVIVHEAVKEVPGLEVVAFERPGWMTGGTHLWIELRMNKDAAGKNEVKEGENVENPAADNRKTDGWFGLGSFGVSVKKKDEKQDGKKDK